MANLEVIRVYSARARQTAGSIGYGAPWPVRLVVWLILLPLAILVIAIGLLLAAGFILIALARTALLSLIESLRRLLGPGDGRRNVRVIRPDERA